MKLSLFIAAGAAGISLLFVSCATTQPDEENWQFPLVEASGESTEEAAAAAQPLLQTDPFRSPDVTKSLPGASPSFSPSLTSPAPRAPLSNATPPPVPRDGQE